MPKSLILVSSDNTFTQFSSESLANFRQVCTCAFLSRGTLRVLEDFSPSRRSVLPIVFLVTMFPAALRSLTRSSCVVLGWFLTSPFSWSLKLYEVRSCKEPQTEGHWQLFCVSHQAACRWSDILGQLFGLGHGGEFGIWLIDCFCRQVSPFKRVLLISASYLYKATVYIYIYIYIYISPVYRLARRLRILIISLLIVEHVSDNFQWGVI